MILERVLASLLRIIREAASIAVLIRVGEVMLLEQIILKSEWFQKTTVFYYWLLQSLGEPWVHASFWRFRDPGSLS